MRARLIDSDPSFAPPHWILGLRQGACASIVGTSRGDDCHHLYFLLIISDPSTGNATRETALKIPIALHGLLSQPSRAPGKARMRTSTLRNNLDNHADKISTAQHSRSDCHCQRPVKRDVVECCMLSEGLKNDLRRKRRVTLHVAVAGSAHIKPDIHHKPD